MWTLRRADIEDACHQVFGFSEKTVEQALRDIILELHEKSPNKVDEDAIVDAFKQGLNLSDSDAYALHFQLDRKVAEKQANDSRASKRRKLEDEKESEIPTTDIPEEPPKTSEEEDIMLLAKLGRDIKYKDNPLYISKLREEARKDYLKEREVSQLELAQRVADERKLLKAS
eukprot:Gregarina_sp_Poly_1__4035@NODE_221_length_11248_cov_177_758072_g195_i0_p9_GENE_NODE_221_length_11248_cov_177_758072_g195_i0NODE_221_length_11248_cov_177_758072_g195_i0_p9_ORF_typecomplete_len172_score44_78_NODE_221_length_11248_cov_177_758072_g195_i092469761